MNLFFIFPKWSQISAEHRSVTSPNTDTRQSPWRLSWVHLSWVRLSVTPSALNVPPRSAPAPGVLGPPACRPSPRPAPGRLPGRHVVPRAASASPRPCLRSPARPRAQARRSEIGACFCFLRKGHLGSLARGRRREVPLLPRRPGVRAPCPPCGVAAAAAPSPSLAPLSCARPEGRRSSRVHTAHPPR